MKILKSTQNFLISQTFADGETNLFCRAKVFDQDLNDVTPSSPVGGYVELSHIYGGFYAYKHSTSLPKGEYIVIFETYEDSGFLVESKKYGIVEENVWVQNFLSEILTEIPDNILLDDDSRLEHLNLIPNLSNETTVTSVGDNIIDELRTALDDSDGGAI